MDLPQKSYDEIVDLFACGSTTAEVLAFRPSDQMQERARYLLARNKMGKLTAEEADELERLGELEHLMQLVKARALFYAEEKH
ncbi:MAG TPA: hypothetical protein VFZ34_15315 [Blastocatellia bacterium]|nr:hypothetical protein [Blastocatellia bacterium]